MATGITKSGTTISDTLLGTLGDDTLLGLGSNDRLEGGEGNDYLDGGVGSDTMIGGLGDDTYIVDSTSDVVIELAGEGIDTVRSSVSLVLGANIENLTLTGTASINASGNALDNVLTGNSGANSLDGGAGADTLIGGAGNDVYIVDNSGDVVIENAGEGTDTVRTSLAAYTLTANVENLVSTGAAGFTGTGNALANSITGGAGNDFLDGGQGNDTLVGGLGNDLYLVDSASDVITEAAAAGTDTALASVSYTIGANVENLTLTGAGNINATGNTLANLLTGNTGDNILDGGTGADTIVGGQGNDTYVVDNILDVVTEAAGEGTDTIRSSLSLTLGANVENLTLTGASSINGTGNALDNVLTGNSGANSLDGGAGADILIGGAGNDVYIVDNSGDVVIENAGEGTDTVRTSLAAYTLTANVENLVSTGAGGFTGTGNALANSITGGAGNDVLDGGQGNDTLVGGLGDDLYRVDSATDVITEATAAGTDTALASVSYSIGTNVENLTLTGSSNINATGNTLANVLTGNDGDNRLDGGSGADTLLGGAGNDTYVVDNSLDVVTEIDGGGTDTVLASVTTTLSAYVENLTLTGAGSINGTGNDLNNVLTGNSGANSLDGGTGADTLIGGAGNDVYIIDNSGDVVIENAGEGTDTVRTSLAAYTLTANVENLVSTGAGGFTGTGNALANSITGGAGNDVLDGGQGNDTLVGGLGDDQYMIDSATDVITEGAAAGTDTALASVSYTIGANVENLTLTGADNINATGNTLANVLTGNDGDNRLDGGSGADTMLGGLGDDNYVVDNALDVVTELASQGTDTVLASVTTTLSANVENLTLTGAGSINGTGNDLNNVLTGNSGANSLDGGAGADILIGGTGNDVYIVDNALDVVTEFAGEGTDTVRTSLAAYTLSENVENFVSIGPGAFVGTGNSLANSITGGAGNDILDGGLGNDTLVGGLGDDQYMIDSATDVITEGAAAGTDTALASVSYTIGANVENLTLTGADNINATGNTLANVLTGNDGDNRLDGGSGADAMLGGLGDDTYVVDNALDVVTELVGQGTDTVLASVTTTLSANVENLTLTGAGSINGTGNDLNNVLTGNSGANSLDGGAGADILIGGTGNDVYIVDNALDVVTEFAGEGTDTVRTSLSTYALSENVENLVATGAGSFAGTGNTLANSITGGAGNDILDGGQGNDTLVGGLGDDQYMIDIATDVITEAAAAGTDTALASVSYTIGANVENLTLTGGGNINATGNTLVNVLTGNDGDNRLDGGSGADTLLGGLGDDTYVVDNALDVVTELVGQGTDTVLASVTTTLSAYVENLTLTGAGSINGTGNDLNNVLTGNSGANSLDGGAGADILIGGTGNDVYIVDNALDVVTEFAGEGTDTVRTSLSTYALSENVENLVATGTDSFAGTGNTLANSITGGAGNDILDGGQGNDTLVGGTGSDLFVYINGSGADVVRDFVATGATKDVIDISRMTTVTTFAQVQGLATQVGANTIIDFGNGDTLTLNNVTKSSLTASNFVLTANHAPVVTGEVAATATEDAASSTLNALANASDIDLGNTLTVVNVPGTLPAGVTYDAEAKSFTLDPSNAAYQSLAAGGTTTVSVSYGVSDGTATTPASVSWTVTGTNDTPTITGAAQTGAVTEDLALTATGQVLASDIDIGAALTYTGSVVGTYGVFAVNATTGAWTYTLVNEAHQELAAGESQSETFMVTVTDDKGASVTQDVVITITGTNDTPVITSADQAGSVTEDGTLTATGQVTVSDVDTGATASFSGDATGTYGSFVVDASSGAWTYTLDNAAHQDLAEGEIHTDTFTVTVTDDFGATTTQDVVITITGTNDTPVITSADQTGAVTEDTSLTATGQVTVSDVDTGAVHTFTGNETGVYGSFTVAATTGVWTYTLDNAAHQDLAEGEIQSDTFTVTVTDDFGATTTQDVVITITGTNDAPVVTGAVTGAATENAATSTLLALANASDVDAGTILSVVNVPGTLPAGVTYDAVSKAFTLDPSNAAYQSLAAGATTTVSVTYGVSDGIATTPATVTWTVIGVDNGPVINVVTGTAAIDTLTGSSGIDSVNALAGDDTIQNLGAGDDSVFGGAGFDRVTYTDVSGPITVDMAAGTVVGDATVGTDMLRDVELLRGTNAADTYTAVGMGATSVNSGSIMERNVLGSFNEFEGMGGNDVITGNGNTRVSYRSAASAVTVNLGTGASSTDGSVGVDVFTGGVNAVRGSDHNDTLTGTDNGNANTESFEGRLGDDLINGAGGFDRAVYEFATGSVNIVMSSGAVTGADGNDTLRSIESVRGSNFGDTYVATNFGNNGTLNVGSNGSFNEFEGFGGDDTIIGNGNTRVAFYAATEGVTVTLGANGSGSATSASIGTDTFISGVNQVTGSYYNDSITGSSANETLDGWHGDDSIDGGTGFDTVRYDSFAVTSGISVDMASGVVNGGSFYGNDLLRGIEAIRGTGVADTYVATGYSATSANANNSGGGSFNQFEGLAGNDTIVGNGFTGMSFFNATGGVTVDFSAGTVSGNQSVGNDIFSGVSTVSGSAFDDVIKAETAVTNGALGATSIFIGGGAGNDTINTSGFANIIVPGLGQLFVSVSGDAGNDTIYGNGFTGIYYGNSTGGVVVNFLTGTVIGDASVGSDNFSNISSVNTSNFNDRIIGGAGHQFISTGGGDDIFVYSTGGGTDFISDFVAGSGSNLDKIDLTGVSGVYSLADIQSRATQQGPNTLINFGNGDSITLNNVTLGNLVANDFIFGTPPVNNPPAVSGPVLGVATEDGASSVLAAIANASDPDAGTILSVVNIPGSLPAGVTYNPVTMQFTLDPSNAAYQALAAGATTTVSVTYGVSDGQATTSASVSWTVTGTNDAPVVTGAVTGTATEDGSTSILNALANASDVDSGAVLSVVNVQDSLPAGVTYDAVSKAFTLDPSSAAYQSLAAGATTTVSVAYGVSDGQATTSASVSWTVTGTNDAPVVTGDVTGAATENAATSTLLALSNASDVDSGAVLSVVNVPGTLPAGVTYDAATKSFTLDPSNAAYQSLAAGATTTVSVTYGVSDGIATTPATVTWTVTGVDNGPVINVVTGTAVNDTLTGSAGFDSVNALAGDDIIQNLGAGDDSVFGGAGFDGIDYGNVSGPISINMATGTVVGDTSVGTDTLRDVEAVRGTNAADSYTAVGMSATSANTGSIMERNILGDFNEFEGMGGNDVITGNGNTRVSYRFAGSAVTVNLSTGASNSDGSVGVDVFNGGINAVRGSDYNDTITGTDNGNTTTEFFEGRLGDDSINGAGGFDRVIYDNATGAVTITMSSGSVTGADGNDILRSIEAVRGSNFGDTYIATNYGNNGTLNIGNNGTFNEFEGKGGNDTITGNGNTRVAFYTATEGVTVTLGANGSGSATSASIGTDTFISGVNQVTGSYYNDSITGSSANEILDGWHGNDTIDGGAGFDTVRYDNVAYPTSGISVDMASGLVNGGTFYGNDLLRGIEAIRGSILNDTYVATGYSATSANANNNGGGTFNRFEGMGGDDIITGNGNTQVAFSNANGNVTVNFAAGTAQGDSSVGLDHFTGVNSALGSNSDDTFNAAGFGTLALDGTTLVPAFNNVAGGLGNDHIIGNGATNLDYSGSSAAVTVNFVTGLATGTNIGTDDFTGASGATGSNSGDILIGDANINSFSGQSGNDTITGGAGADNITSGAGADEIVFNRIADLGGADRLFDFATGIDHLLFAGDINTTGATGFIAANGVFNGSLLFEAGNATSTVTATTKLIWDSTGHDLYVDSDGGSAANRILVAHLENGLNLAATDIKMG